MSKVEIFSMKNHGKPSFDHRGTKQVSTEADKAFESEGKTTKKKPLDVYINLDPSLKGWTENSVLFPYKNKKHFNSNRGRLNSIYCEVLNNGNCHECQTAERKLRNIHSSLVQFPDLETGGYLLFQTLSKRQKIPERTTFSALSVVSAPAATDSGYSSWSPNSGSALLRHRVRAASAVMSDLNRKPIGSVRLNSQARPLTSKNVRFEDSTSRRRVWSLSSRASNSSSARKISPMSQEGWSEKQIEAWKLLAPTPPRIEVSQMNVSMYTPKELPGIKIFDESLFVI